MLRQRLRPTFHFLIGACLIAVPAFVILPHHPLEARIRDDQSDDAAPAHLERERVFRIVAFGSSTTRGYGASSEAATYPA